LVVGLVGRIGSGKTVAAKHLTKKYNADYQRFSQIFMDVLERLNLPVNRLNLQTLGRVLREEFGPDVVVNAFDRDLRECNSESVVVDGIRYENEVMLLRRYPRNILVYIHSSPEERYERVRRRGEKGEATVSWEEFKQAENRETERYIEDLKGKADYIINNSESIEDLKKGIDKIMGRELNH